MIFSKGGGEVGLGESCICTFSIHFWAGFIDLIIAVLGGYDLMMGNFDTADRRGLL